MLNLKKFRSVLALVSMCAMAGGAQAVSGGGTGLVPVTGTDASAAPGAVAMPTVTFDFGSGYDFTSATFSIDYDPLVLSFDPVASKLSYGGNEASFGAALDAFLASPLGSMSPPPASGPDYYSLTVFLESGSYPLAGPMVLKGAFTVLPGVSIGTVSPVKVSGSMSSLLSDQSLEVDPFDITVNVAAVPEPETWLMLAGGLVVVLAQRRRRASARA